MPSMECEQEFEVLESIYKEIEVVPETSDGGSLVSILVYPKSAGDIESRYVTLKLEFHLPPTYPTNLPIVQIRNPRGLSEEQLVDLENNVKTINNEFAGSPVIFQLIDMVQDYLTTNNRPTAECPICLMLFTEADVFYTPSCFHHYHSHWYAICLVMLDKLLQMNSEKTKMVIIFSLGLHLQSVLKKDAPETRMPSSPIKMSCPVCRVEFDPLIDVGKLLSSPPAAEEIFDMVADVSKVNIGQGRDDLEAIFLKQKKQGGIINLDEDCKRLLRISTHDNNSESMFSSGDASIPDVEQKSNHQSPCQTQSYGRQHPPHVSRSKGFHSHQQHHKPFRYDSCERSAPTHSNRAPHSYYQGHGQGRRQENRHSSHASTVQAVKSQTLKETREIRLGHSSTSTGVITKSTNETGGERTGSESLNHLPTSALRLHRQK